MDLKLLCQKLREQFKEAWMNESEKEFEKEFKALSDSLTPKSKKKKKTRKSPINRPLNGFTKPEALVKPVVDVLEQFGPKAKKYVAAEICKLGILTPKDLETHLDGQIRVYKTLDRTRRLLVKQSVIETKNGIWSLK